MACFFLRSESHWHSSSVTWQARPQTFLALIFVKLILKGLLVGCVLLARLKVETLDPVTDTLVSVVIDKLENSIALWIGASYFLVVIEL